MCSVRELEALVGQSRQVHPAGQTGATSKAPALFGAGPPPGPLSSQDWVKLRRLAGPPPKHSQAEARRQRVTAGTSAADNSYVAMEREIEEEGVLDTSMVPGIDLEVLKQTADPMQQLMVSQLQQNQILLQKLIAPRHSDPMFNLLDGGSGSSSGGNSGIRGCLARDAFVKSMEDLPKIAQVVEANAAKELGISPERIDMTLMRRYVERRMPLAEHRLLTYISFLLADAWSIGYSSGNIELMGAVSKMLVFVEQTHAWTQAGCNFHVAHGSPRPAFSDFDVESKEGRTATLFPISRSDLAIGESGLCQRPGYSGVEGSSSWQTWEGHHRRRGDGSRCSTKSKATAETPKETRGRKRTKGARQQQHRGRIGQSFPCLSSRGSSFLDASSYREGHSLDNPITNNAHDHTLPDYPFLSFDNPDEKFCPIRLAASNSGPVVQDLLHSHVPVCMK